MFNHRNHIFYAPDGSSGAEESNLPEDDMLWEYVEVEEASGSSSNVEPLVVDVTEDNSSYVLSEPFMNIVHSHPTIPVVFRIYNVGGYRYFYLAGTSVFQVNNAYVYRVSLFYPYFDDATVDKVWDFDSSSNTIASLTYTP